MPHSPLPIDAVLPDVVAALRSAGAVVLRAPTGAGKTTRVPPAILDAGLAGRGTIIVLQPRRLAAKTTARRMAFERGTPLGEEVGYQVRFERRAGPRTRIQVVTEGILLRMLQDDPFLEKVAVVVFDEFHERSLNSDLALAMVRRVRETVRPEMKLVVMSATLAAGPVVEYLGSCSFVECEGRLHPVEITYVEEGKGDWLRAPEGIGAAHKVDRSVPVPFSRTTASPHHIADRAADGVYRILDLTDGDVLVFLPGVGEIRQTARLLEPLAAARNLAVMPLYGDLPAEKQDEVLMPLAWEKGTGTERQSVSQSPGVSSARSQSPFPRKIVLATNVAETSITIEGITGVVDTGAARSPVFDPHVGMDRLQLVRISQASADQRAGRAGRTRPGVCLRLWPERTHRLRPAHDEPEIRRLDLAGPVLQLRAWGEADLDTFPWFEPPAGTTLEQAETLLRRLDALDAAGNVTELGRAIARLPVSPRLGRMLVEGQRLGQPEAVALAAALLSQRDPFPRAEADASGRRAIPASSDSDVLDRVAALEAFEQSGRIDTPLGRINRSAAHFVLHTRNQLLRELGGPEKGKGTERPTVSRSSGDSHARSLSPSPSPDEAVLRSLLAAFPDRLVRRSDSGSRFGRMVGGRGVRLAASSAVRNAPLFLAVDVDRGTSEALVWRASAVERDWLPAEHLSLRTEVEFDPATRRVIARRRVYWEDLLLEESPEALPGKGDWLRAPKEPESTQGPRRSVPVPFSQTYAEEVTRILSQAAADSLPEIFPWDDPATSDYLNRVRCLAQWMPGLELPVLDDDGLRALLPTVAQDCRSFDDLRKAPWLAHIQNLLTHPQRQAVECEAPERIEVPSGSRIKLRYEPGRPPVLAVRIQEIFGMLETPRVARGRVAVLLHLLAPNMRPQQVTDDLASFWRTTYHQVRKDLRRRYPKHAWPEDPYTATAERRPRQKG